MPSSHCLNTSLLDTTIKILDVVSTHVGNYQQHKTNIEEDRQNLLNTVSEECAAGSLSDIECNKMKDLISTQRSTDLNNLKERVRAVKLDLSEQKTIMEKSTEKLKSGLTTAWKGIRSMSKTEAVEKSTNALSGILGAVKKFNSDKALDVVSGVADITNTAASFLPPPASIVTGAISGLLNIFGAGGPSTVDVVKEQFKQMKDFTKKQFEAQNKFIKGEFEAQQKFISGEFQAQNKLIKEGFDSTNKLIKGEFEAQTLFIGGKLDAQNIFIDERFNDLSQMLSGKFKDISDFLRDGHFKDLLVDAIAIQESLEPVLIKLDTYKHEKLNDVIKNNILRYVENNEKNEEFSRIRLNFENLCLDGKLLQVNQTYGENSICSHLLFTYLTIHQQRDNIQADLISKLYESPKFRLAAKSQVELLNDRKQKMRTWLLEKIIQNDDISCPLFSSDKGTQVFFWYSSQMQEQVLSSMKQIVGSVPSKNPSECSKLREANMKKHCQCSLVGSRSGVCDIRSHCFCKPMYEGQTCQTSTGVLLITGGYHNQKYRGFDSAKGEWRESLWLSSVEMYDPVKSLSCRLPKMKFERNANAAVGSTVCGGGEGSQNCETFSNGRWRKSHNLKQLRGDSVMWRTPSGKIVLMGGGYDNNRVAEILQDNGRTVESWRQKDGYPTYTSIIDYCHLHVKLLQVCMRY